MPCYNDFQRSAMLFKTFILIGMKLCKNLLVLTLGNRHYSYVFDEWVGGGP